MKDKEMVEQLNKSMPHYVILRYVVITDFIGRGKTYEVRIIHMSNDLEWLVSMMEENDNIFQMH